MNTAFKPAEILRDVPAAVTLEPLQPGDPRYVDLSSGGLMRDLKLLQQHLESSTHDPINFSKATLTGHRGCGKTTVLLRLEQKLRSQLYPLHLQVDQNLERDFDYTDMLLWIVDALSRHFAENNMPLNKGLVNDVADWFAARTLEDVNQVKSEIEASASAETKAKAGFYWLSLGLLARIKSSIVGSTERRQIIRRALQQYSSDLIERVNLVLDDAHHRLAQAGHSIPLLLVQDNLDRLPADTSRRLFIENGDLLKNLRVRMLFTAPIAIVMAPYNIGTVFEKRFHMPTINPRLRNGAPNKPGQAALNSLLAGRLNLEKVFTDSNLANDLVLMSGGTVRDLLRLAGYAAAEAMVDDKPQIDSESTARATTHLRHEFEGLLIPSQVYYPILARIHHTKRDELLADPAAKPENVQNAREFFGQLLFNGSVLEYNGDGQWFDAHPAIQSTRAFKDALKSIHPGTAASGAAA